MKRSWKKKASVWTMAAAMTVSYIPQYSFAEETTENIKQETQTQTIEEQTILGNLTSEALATERIPETSLQKAHQKVYRKRPHRNLVKV